MFTQSRAAALALIAPLMLATLSGAASADNRASGLSHLREDPYYPDKGDPRIDALHYGLELNWNRKARTLTGAATIRVRITRDVQRVQLDLGAPLRVGEVLLDGTRVPAYHRGKNLHVVTGALQRNSRHTLRITYAGTPQPVRAPVSRSDFSKVGWTTTSSGDVWTMQQPFGAFTWYPANDHPSDKATYDVTITAPGDSVGVFNGKLLDRRTVAGRTVTRWHLGSPSASYLTTIAIGNYSRYRDTGPHGLPISYWVEPRDRDLLPLLRKTPSMIGWLETRLGRYPFRRVGAVVVPSQSAMETQTLVTMGRALGRSPLLFVNDLLHEYVHQWYGGQRHAGQLEGRVAQRKFRHVCPNPVRGLARHCHHVALASDAARL
jgi:aminopeptidase N